MKPNWDRRGQAWKGTVWSGRDGYGKGLSEAFCSMQLGGFT